MSRLVPNGGEAFGAPRTYDVPEGASACGVSIPAGPHTAEEIAEHLNASGQVNATVIPAGLQVEGVDVSSSEPAVGVGLFERHARAADKLVLSQLRLPESMLKGEGMNRATAEATILSRGLSLFGGTTFTPNVFVIGRVRLYRDPHDKLADNPCARRHHASGCRWRPGKGGSARGWLCVGSCQVPALLDEKAARDEAEGIEDNLL